MRRRRGTGSIESYTDSKGAERFRARLVLPTGEKKPVGVYDSEREADLALLHAADKITEGELATELGITLRQWGPKFLDQREEEKVRGIKTERNRWKNLVDAHPIADIPMRQVTKRDARAWLRWLDSRTIKYAHKHSKNGQKLGRTTKQNARNLVSKAFDKAFEDVDGAPANPFDGVNLPKDKGRTHEPWTYLEPHEQTALLAAVPEPDRFLVAFALGTGLRQGEQWSLRWADVDSAKREIVVRFGSEGQPTKSGKIRRVPLFGIALDALAHYVATGVRVAAQHRVWGNSSGDRRQKGEPDGWKGWVKAAGITRNVRWHDLRHTCASSLIAGWWGRKWSLYEVKEMLGHASITTTERYSHLADSALKLAAAETKPAVSPLESGRQDLMLPPSSENYSGATLGIRTPDLRFTKPHASSDLTNGSVAVGTASGLSKTVRVPLPVWDDGSLAEKQGDYEVLQRYLRANAERNRAAAALKFLQFDQAPAESAAGLPELCACGHADGWHSRLGSGCYGGSFASPCGCLEYRPAAPPWAAHLPPDVTPDEVLADLAPRVR